MTHCNELTIAEIGLFLIYWYMYFRSTKYIGRQNSYIYESEISKYIQSYFLKEYPTLSEFDV